MQSETIDKTCEITMPSDKPRISFVCDSQIKDALEKLAELDSRSVSNVVLLAVREYIAKAKSEGKL